ALTVRDNQPVVAAASWRTVGFESAGSLLGGEFDRGHLFGVIDAADHDGVIRIALQEIDDDLLADARDLEKTPLFAGPVGGHADPARAIGVVLALAVPVKLHFDS